jgi:hypothetical protein
MNIVNGISVKLLNNDRSITRRHGARREQINEEDEVEKQRIPKKCREDQVTEKAKKRRIKR